MKLTDFKALTFDCYGTLIDWETGILAAFAPLAADHLRHPALPGETAVLHSDGLGRLHRCLGPGAQELRSQPRLRLGWPPHGGLAGSLSEHRLFCYPVDACLVPGAPPVSGIAVRPRGFLMV